MMSRIITLIIIAAFQLPAFAQPSGNVGIEINQPENRLHVHDSIVNVFGEPPFQFTTGADNFIQVTNGVSGTTENDGLLMGITQAGGAEIKHPFNMEIETGQAGIHLNDANSQVAVIGDMLVSSLAGQGMRSLLADPSGNVVAQSNQFSRFKSFPTNTTWIVPPDVTLIKVELWGAGGGGGLNGGGGGGGYVCGLMDVSPGESIIIAVGSPVQNGTGGTTTLMRGSDGFSAPGGFSAFAGGGAGGSSGGPLTSNTPHWFGFPGNDGRQTTVAYHQRTSTQFIEVYELGDGGGSYRHPTAGSPGEVRVIDVSTGSLITNFDADNGNVPGGGAGGNSLSLTFSGKGLVIIHW